jgi:hypothetical protein
VGSYGRQAAADGRILFPGVPPGTPSKRNCVHKALNCACLSSVGMFNDLFPSQFHYDENIYLVR